MSTSLGSVPLSECAHHTVNLEDMIVVDVERVRIWFVIVHATDLKAMFFISFVSIDDCWFFKPSDSSLQT